ncbi:MAG: transposase [Clostridia bacterium]|nr:transposase [Clostridia bacterium]
MNEQHLPQRKRIRLRSFDYNQNGAFFITICTRNRRCLLSHIVGTGVLDGPQMELTNYGKIADKHLYNMSFFYDDLTVEKYVIMPNHIHLLIRICREESVDGPSGTPVPTKQNSMVSRFVSSFKRFCNKEYGENIWQRGSHDHIIRNSRDYVNIRNYIELNPMYWKKDRFYTEGGKEYDNE